MLIWGSVGIFVRMADSAAATIVFARVAVACIAISLYLLVKRQKVSLGKSWKITILSGLALSLNWLFYFKAIQSTTIGNAVLTYYLAPLFSIIWARIFLGEMLERRVIYALGLAAGGILLMLSGHEFSLASTDFIGILYGLTGAFFYSMVVVMAKGLDDVEPTHLVLVQMAVATLIFFPQVMTQPPTISAVSATALVIMGLVHSALALGLYFSGLKAVKVQHASVLSYVDPVSAFVFAYFVFGEVPTLHTAIGGLAILGASYIVMKKPASGDNPSTSC